MVELNLISSIKGNVKKKTFPTVKLTDALEFGAGLWKQAFPVDFQQLGSFLRRIEFGPKLKGNLLCLRFSFTTRAN